MPEKKINSVQLVYTSVREKRSTDSRVRIDTEHSIRRTYRRCGQERPRSFPIPLKRQILNYFWRSDFSLPLATCAAAAVFVYLLLFKLPSTPFFGDSDQSIFLYEAERLLRGEVMYRDFFEFTLPGTQVVYAALFAVFGTSFWIAPAVTVVLSVATAWLLTDIARRFIPSPYYCLPAILYIFFGFRWFGSDGSHRTFSPVFVLIAIRLLIGREGRFKYFLIGFSLAFASFFTQQRGVVMLGAIVLFFALEFVLGKVDFRSFLTRVTEMTAAFAILLTALCAYFIWAAGAENFFYATVVYPFRFYSYGHPNNYGVYLVGLRNGLSVGSASDALRVFPVIFHAVLLPLAAPVILIVLAIYRKAGDWAEWRVPVAIAIAATCLTVTTTGPNQFRFYLISGIPMLVLVWAIHKLIRSERVRFFAFGAFSLLLGMIAAFQVYRAQGNWQFEYLEFPVGRVAMVASDQSRRYRWLSENTKPGEYFFEVYEPFVYFPLGLRNPTRVGQFWPSEYTRPEQVAEAVRDLAAKRPRLILWDNGYLKEPREAGDNLAPLAHFVAENYSPIGEIYEIDGKAIQFWEIRSK
jgi:hypothetical protein